MLLASVTEPRSMTMEDQVNAVPAPKRVPWNKGKLTGEKPRSALSTSGQSGQNFRLRAGPATWRCSIWQSTASFVVVMSSQSGLKTLRQADTLRIARRFAQKEN